MIKNYIACVLTFFTASLLPSHAATAGEDTSLLGSASMTPTVSLFSLIAQPEDYLSTPVVTAGVFAHTAAPHAGVLYVNQESRESGITVNGVFLRGLALDGPQRTNIHGKYVTVSGAFVCVDGQYGIEVDRIVKVNEVTANPKTRSRDKR